MLHFASFDGHVALVRLLLDAGAQIEAKDNGGATPLYGASQEGHLEAARLLLACGAAVDEGTNDGSNSLMIASEMGHIDVVRELLAHGAAINARADVGRTPLISACAKGHLAAATLLLDAGADPALLDNAGWSALRYAALRVELDDEEPEEGEEAPTAAQVEEHKALVALLKARGA